MKVTASFLGDALGELLEAVAVLLEGADEARCSWAEEPGERRWIFDRAGSGVRLRVLAFLDDGPREPDERGRIVFVSAAPLREVAEAIAGGAQSVLDEYGEEGYRRRWVEYPFRVGHLEVIQARFADEGAARTAALCR